MKENKFYRKEMIIAMIIITIMFVTLVLFQNVSHVGIFIGLTTLLIVVSMVILFSLISKNETRTKAVCFMITKSLDLTLITLCLMIAIVNGITKDEMTVTILFSSISVALVLKVFYDLKKGHVD